MIELLSFPACQLSSVAINMRQLGQGQLCYLFNSSCTVSKNISGYLTSLLLLNCKVRKRD